MSEKIIGVLGLGIFGTTLAEKLAASGQDVIAIDNNPDHVTPIADKVTKAIIGDITNLDTLKDSGIGECQEVVIATGNHLESAVLALMHCKKLEVPYIAAKAKSETFQEVLYEVGADQVISPERESGLRLASNLMRHHIQNLYTIGDGLQVIEFQLPTTWENKSLNKLNLRKTYDLNVIGYRTNHKAPLNTTLTPDTVFPTGATILAITASDTFEKYDYLNVVK